MSDTTPRLGLSSNQLLAFVADLGHPAVSFGRVEIRDADDWRRVALRATPGERLRLLMRLDKNLLVASPHGRARLRAWLDAQRLEPSASLPGWLERKWLAERLLHFGDVELTPVIIEGLMMTPRPVRAAVVAECMVISVGRSSSGWTSSAKFIDKDGQSRPQAIVLCGAGRDDEQLVRLAIHEFAHSWHRALPGAWSQTFTAIAEARVRALMVAEQWVAGRAAEMIDRDERLARALELVWCEQPWREQG